MIIQRNRIVAILVLLTVVLFVPHTTKAWTRSNFSERNNSADRDLRVPSGRLAFRIEERGSFEITDGSDIEAIRAAFRAITAVSTSTAVIDDAGRFSYPASVGSRDGLKLDGMNNIYFYKQHDPASPAIATTTTFYNVATGEIQEADIAINEADYDYSTADQESPNDHLAYYTFDIQEIVTHECMHALGFGHSPVIGQFDPATGCQASGWVTGDFTGHATMFPYASGTTTGRTLSSDDVAALSSVYPNGSQTGAISGRVTKGETGAALKGAHVVAVSVDDPGKPIAGTISGIAQDNASGDFTIAGLPPGNYYVRIEPLVGTTNPFTEQATAFTNFSTGFVPEFYSGDSETFWDASVGMDDAASIRVEAGSRVTGVEFVTNNAPETPMVSKATFKRGKLKVSGDNFLAGAIVVEMDGYIVHDVTFPAASVGSNGVARKLVSKDPFLGTMMTTTTPHSLVVVNTVTGTRSAAVIVQQ